MSFGDLIGSAAAYIFGLRVGRMLILKYEKYVFLKEEHLGLTEKWFKRYGDKAIFFSRPLPVVGAVNSLPAGIGKMNFKKLSVYTFVGSLPWSYALTYIGVWFGKNWESEVGLPGKAQYSLRSLFHGSVNDLK